jgi:hypothetical protein
MTNQETEIVFDEMSKIIRRNGVFEVEYKEAPTLSFI